MYLHVSLLLHYLFRSNCRWSAVVVQCVQLWNYSYILDKFSINDNFWSLLLTIINLVESNLSSHKSNGVTSPLSPNYWNKFRVKSKSSHDLVSSKHRQCQIAYFSHCFASSSRFPIKWKYYTPCVFFTKKRNPTNYKQVPEILGSGYFWIRLLIYKCIVNAVFNFNLPFIFCYKSIPQVTFNTAATDIVSIRL